MLVFIKQIMFYMQKQTKRLFVFFLKQHDFLHNTKTNNETLFFRCAHAPAEYLVHGMEVRCSATYYATM